MLRILLRLLPLTALSVFSTADAEEDTEDHDGAEDDDSGSDDEAKFTQSDVEAIIAKRLNRERRKIENDLTETVRAQLKEEAERAAAEEAEEFKPLYESEKDKREKAEAKAGEVEASWRTRLVRAEIKVAAAQQKFVDVEVAQKLVDLDAVTFDEDGEPTNIGELITGLVKAHPYLVQDEKNPVKPVEESRANGKAAGSDDIRNRYLKQAGVAPAEA